MSIVRKSPAHADAQAVAASTADWHRHMRILERQLETTGAYAAEAGFTLGDVALGVSTHRWLATPMERPRLPAVEVYYERLSERPAFVKHVRSSTP